MIKTNKDADDFTTLYYWQQTRIGSDINKDGLYEKTKNLSLIDCNLLDLDLHDINHTNDDNNSKNIRKVNSRKNLIACENAKTDGLKVIGNIGNWISSLPENIQNCELLKNTNNWIKKCCYSNYDFFCKYQRTNDKDYNDIIDRNCTETKNINLKHMKNFEWNSQISPSLRTGCNDKSLNKVGAS